MSPETATELSEHGFSYLLPTLETWPTPHAVDVAREPVTSNYEVRILWTGLYDSLCQLVIDKKRQLTFTYYRNGVTKKLSWDERSSIPGLLTKETRCSGSN